MVIADPKKATVNLPDDYLIAIGKVCVQWSVLEGMMEIVIAKLAGFQFRDPRSKIMVNHMAWPMRMDIFSALCDALMAEHPRLKNYAQVAALLRKAADGRNRIVHGFWGSENGKVTMLRASARGKLKLSMEHVPIGDIHAILNDIHVAAAEMYNLAIGS